MTAETARFVLTAGVTLFGVLVCVCLFMGLAALGNVFRINSRPQDDPPPASYLTKMNGDLR